MKYHAYFNMFSIRNITLLATLSLSASAAESISLTVDATQTPRKLLHANLVLPVTPGPTSDQGEVVCLQGAFAQASFREMAGPVELR
jgi:hypothetical protein